MATIKRILHLEELSKYWSETLNLIGYFTIILSRGKNSWQRLSLMDNYSYKNKEDKAADQLPVRYPEYWVITSFINNLFSPRNSVKLILMPCTCDHNW